MAIDIRNLGTPQIVEATFVAQAVDAGIIPTIKSLITLATDEVSLLADLKAALAVANPPLAEALGLDTLRAILRYMDKVDRSIGYGEHIPELLDENGPAAIWPVYYDDAGGERVEAGTPIEEQSHRAGFVGFHALINGGLYHSGSLPADTTANLVIPVELPPGEYTLRVCYVNADRDTTRLSPPATFTVA